MLATRFASNKRELVSSVPLTEIQMQQVAPSVFALEPHESRSERYSYIPTIEVLRGLRREGFEVYGVTQAKSRIEGKSEFTKHMLRLRHAQTYGRDGGTPEIVLINSHDGTSSYQLLAGWFEFLCSNGLVRGTKAGEIRVAHKGDLTGLVINGAHELLSDMRDMADQREAMRCIALNEGERRAFATAALALRYEEGKAPIGPETVLRPRRIEEQRPDVWTTFNVTQENLIRGGQRGRRSDMSRTTTREISGIDQKVGINRGLWVLAEEMRKLKSAA